MALGKGAISVRFAGGVDTKTDPKQVPSTKLLRLENGVFTRATSLVLRNGHEALPRETETGEAYPAINAIGVRDDELVGFDRTSAWTYLEERQAWKRIGPAYSWAASERTVARTASAQTMGDHATAGGFTVVAWEDSRGGVWFAVLDAESGHMAIEPQQVSATGIKPRCARTGDLMHVYWGEAGTGTIWRLIITPSNLGAAVTPQIMLSDATAAVLYDVEETPAFGTVIVWATATGWRLGYVTPAGSLGTIGQGLPNPITVAAAGITAIAVAWNWPALLAETPTLQPLLVVYQRAGVIQAQPRSSLTFTSAGALTTLASSVGTVTGLTAAWSAEPVDEALNIYRAWVAWGVDSGGNPRDRFVQVTSFTTGGIAGTVRIQGGCDLVSRAFQAGAAVAVHVVHAVPLFGVYFALTISDTPIGQAARILPGVAGGVPQNGHLASVQRDFAAPDQVRWIAGFRTQLEGDEQFSERGLQLVSYDLAGEQSHRSAQLGRGLYVAGALPLLYDSAAIGEAGISYAADGPIGAVASAGGNLTAERTVSYQVVYEAILANGEILPGPPSLPLAVELGAGETRVMLTIPTYRHTGWSNVRIAVYRSEADDGNAQPARYRVTSLDPSASTGSNRYLLNDTAADTVVFVDDLSDADLIAREPLYTNGGILANDPVGGGSVIAGGKGRLFVTDPSDPNRVNYSQEIRAGYAAEFSPQLGLTVDPYGGPVRALAVLDDAVIVFKESAIYFFAGTGPLANPGAGGGFSQPALITADVGCAVPRSVVTTPSGVMFQSAKGIYLLDRGRQVSYVGAPVEGFREQSVVAATLVQDRTQVRFLCGPGQALLYDYFFGQWSTFTNHEGLDAALVAGRYNYVRLDGTLYREVESYRDDAVPVRMAIETAEIRLQDVLQGMQRVWWVLVLGTYLSPHRLHVRYATDYERRWSSAFEYRPETTRTATPWGEGPWGAGPWGGEIEERYQFQIHVGEKCESIRFRFETWPDPDEPGACVELSELLLTGGVRKPDYRPLGEGRTP